MPKKFRYRHRREARREAFQEPKSLILVVTEGEITEPEYFRGYAKACQNPRVDVEVSGGKGVPRTVVENAKEEMRKAKKRARREHDDNLIYDEVWCVFDVDQHPNIPGAIQMARDNGIEVAISNPCFELWLWLHFGDQPGARHRHELQSMMKQHIPNYDKHVNFDDYRDSFLVAEQRAERLAKQATQVGDHLYNPTTGVWRLTKSIRRDSVT